MNERQRDLFLWLWSRRRKPGREAISLRGALIGAAGALLFTLIMSPGAPADIPAYNTWGRMVGAVGEHLRMLALAVPAFAGIGWLGARNVYVQQEKMYQALLASGAQPPEEKPRLTFADRGPALAVAAAVIIIAGFVITLIVMHGMGAL